MPSSACDWSSDVCSSDRSEEHTSELQSRSDLVCRLLLEKKKLAARRPPLGANVVVVARGHRGCHAQRGCAGRGDGYTASRHSACVTCCKAVGYRLRYPRG